MQRRGAAGVVAAVSKAMSGFWDKISIRAGIYAEANPLLQRLIGDVWCFSRRTSSTVSAVAALCT